MVIRRQFLDLCGERKGVGLLCGERRFVLDELGAGEGYDLLSET